MITWEIQERVFTLKYIWRLSRNSSTEKTNFFVKVSANGVSGIGEAAPNIRYHETPEILRNEWERFLGAQPYACENINSLTEILDSLQLPNALRFAIESAYIHFYCRSAKVSIYEFLGIQAPGRIYTAFSLPIMPAGDIGDFIKENNLHRFGILKVKVDRENASDLVHAVAKESKATLRVDANEGFRSEEECLKFMKEIEGLPVEFIEQPLPADRVYDYITLKKNTKIPVMADESVLDNPDFGLLEKQFHGINMKLMKAGGYLNGVRILKEARRCGMKTMIGCMVESTLGISSGMHLCSLADYADLDGSLIIKDEPFGLVEEKNGELIFE